MTRMSRPNFFAFLFVLVVSSLALFAQDFVPVRQAKPTAEEEAVEQHNLKLSFDNVLEMGDVYAQEKKHGEFFVKNVGESDETIVRIVPTCECLRLDREYTNIALKPGEEVKVEFVMDASTVNTQTYMRFIKIVSLSSKTFEARVMGTIVQPAEILPGRCVEMGLLKDPATPWKHVFQINGNPEMGETLVLGDVPENENLNLELTDKGNGNYELVVTPKGSLPYKRQYHPYLRIPILHPANANEIVIELNAQVGEAVNFAPDKWPIMKDYLEEVGTLTERFAYGEVPGLQEERKKGDPAADKRSMMRLSLLKQHNAVPLRFVKEHHDWDNLFEHLEFQVPNGVTVEKIRHPQGIELKITVTAEAFKETDSVQVIPFRDQNKMAPIEINAVEE